MLCVVMSYTWIYHEAGEKHDRDRDEVAYPNS